MVFNDQASTDILCWARLSFVSSCDSQKFTCGFQTPPVVSSRLNRIERMQLWILLSCERLYNSLWTVKCHFITRISTLNAGVLCLELGITWCSRSSGRISQNFTFRWLGQFVLKPHMVLNLFSFKWLSHLLLWRWKTQLRNHCVGVTTGSFIQLSMEGEKKTPQNKMCHSSFTWPFFTE